MKRFLALCAFTAFLAFVPAAKAQVNQRAFGYCQQGGVIPTLSGLQLQNAAGTSVQNVMANYPGCTVTVYFSGTLSPAPLFSDTINTPLANPFTANLTTGYWFFYAATGRYDVQLSGAGITTPFTLGDISLGNTGGGGGGGATPAPPPFSIQKANINATNLAPSALSDNGTTVTNTEPWNQLANATFLGPNPYPDLTAYGAASCNPNATPCTAGLTATVSSGSTNVTISAPSTFAINNGVVIYGAGPAPTMTTPSAPTVTNALASGGTGTGVVVNSAAGSATKCYKIVARDVMGGLTAASPETCTTTSQATLGGVTVNLSSCTRSGTTVTCTTSANHPVLVGCNGCGEVFIGGTSDVSFRGWYPVGTAANATTFTWTNPVVSTSNAPPAPTSSTGGTATFFPANHLTWTQVTGAWVYYTYCGASGAETLCGISNPQGTNTDTTWDDFTNLQGNWQFPPWVPTTPPSSPISDNLSTKIVGGAGTTQLVVADSAGTTVTNATIRLDLAPAIKSAVTAFGSFLVPLPTTVGNVFPINSFVDLRSNNINVQLYGPIQANDTLAVGNIRLTGYGAALMGNNGPGSWSAGKPGFSVFGGARPGLYVQNGAQAGPDIRGVNFSGCGGFNGCLLVLVEGGFSMNFDTLDFNTGTTSNDLMGIGLYLRGSAGQSAASVVIDKVAFAAGNTTDGTSHNAVLYCNLCGDVHIREAYNVHRGMIFSSPSAGGGLEIDNMHYNGGGTPLVSTITGGGNSIIVSFNQVIMDTIAHPCLSALGDRTLLLIKVGCSPSSGVSTVTGGAVTAVEGMAAGGSANTLIGGALTGGQGNNSTTQAGQTSNMVWSRNDGPISTSSKGTIYVAGGIPATPTATLIAGGSIAVGTTVQGYVVPVWVGGYEGIPSLTSNVVTTTTGNQQVTVTGTTLSNPAPQCYNLYASYNGGGPQLPSAAICLSTPTFTFNGTQGASYIMTSLVEGGSSMMLPGAQGITAPQFVLPNSGFVGNLVAGTLTGNRVWTFPDASFTVVAPNLTNTFTVNQNIANGAELHFFSNDLTHFAGFKGGASTTNLVWLFPTTDSSGTQCLSSNGSLQLAWSACSAGTGTPGGANTQVQFNNSGSFGGSGNLTWTSPTLTIGAAGATTGQLAMTGATSGTVTVTPQATAGSPTLTLPNTTGTFADGASAPLVLSATTGNLTCPTCTTNAAALTNNLIVLGAGGQATQIGPAGTTTTVLHGNAAGAPTYSAVNLGTETTGTTAIGNGGTGQTTASAAFNALAPATSTGGLILGTGTNTYGNLGIGGNGLCLVSNGTTAAWSSCASGSVGGNGVSAQVAFWNGASSIAGNANWTYSSASGQSLTQGANGSDALFMKRFTDTTPTGNFLHFQNNAANTDMFKVDVSGNLTVAGSVAVNSSTVAGAIQLGQGPAPSLVANTVQLIAPTSVAASGEQFAFPGNPSSGFIRWTNSGGTLTGNFVTASGVGTCSATTVVNQTNDNAAPTCTNLLASMFTSQGANQFLAAPNGSSGVPTFRTIVGADVPAILLNSGGNGGVASILGIANGGTNASTANGGFNNLSPMTTQGDIIYGGSSGAGTRLAAGTSTQVLLGGTTPSWGAVNLGTMTTGTTAIGNGGTGQVTASAAFNALAPTASANALIFSNGTNTWTSLAAGGAGTLCLTETAGGSPTWGSCSGSAATAWSSLTNPSGNLSLSMAANTTIFTWGAATGASVNPFTIADTTNNTGTGDLVLINTASGSALSPFRVAAKGTANGIEMNTSGVLASIGTGSITANTLNQALNTTSPLGGGGTQTGALTLTCTTCVTSGSALTNNAVVIGSGGGQGAASVSVGTSGQVLQTNGSGSSPAFVDVSQPVYAPAANCVNAIAGSGWSTSATPASLCRAGTNNKDALLSPWGASDVAYFKVHLPNDWDSSASLDISIDLTSTDATNGHTIIMQAATACAKGDGSTTDDVSFNTAQSFGTITLNGNANRTWNATLTGLTKTGCIAGSTLWIEILRTTDTATNVGVYGATVDIARLMKVQAN